MYGTKMTRTIYRRENLVGEALTRLYEQYGIKREDLWLQTKYVGIDRLFIYFTNL